LWDTIRMLDKLLQGKLHLHLAMTGQAEEEAQSTIQKAKGHC